MTILTTTPDFGRFTVATPLPDNPPWLPGADWARAFGELHSATDAMSRVVDNFDGRDTAIRDAYAARIERIRTATGVTLDNPATRDPTMLPDWLSLQGVGRVILDPVLGAPENPYETFWSRASELAGQHPDKVDLITGGPSIIDEARTIARTAATRQARAADDARLGPVARVAATLSGGLVGAFRDPLNVATLFVGGAPAGLARTAVGRIAAEAGGQAVMNAAIEALTQGNSQSWREELGLEHGFAQAATNVGIAAGFGAIMGGGIQGGREIIRALKGSPAPPALPDVAPPASRQDAPAPAAADDAARVAETGVADMEADTAAWAPPPDLAPADAAAMRAEAVRTAQYPDASPPPAPRLPRPAAPADVARLTDEATPGAPLVVDGKPITFQQFRPAELGTDATAYQYKGGANDEGVTDRLAGVKRWDPVASGKVFVHERADGGLYIADGHQRLGLAKRLAGEGQAVALDGYRFREADGWTAADVRALAAKKNMQEGSGSPLDAARVLRDRPDLWDDSLPTSGPLMRRAAGLARLSDDAWGMTVNGLASEPHAALVGEMVPDPSAHAGMLADLTRFDPPTERAARLLIGEMQTAGTIHETQFDMFGSLDLTRSLIGERVKVLDAALQMLRKDKRLFGTLAENRDVLEAAGNVIDDAASRQRADSADLLIALFERMARSRGPVSDMLSESARRVAAGGKPATEARGFVDAVRGAIERDGLGRLLSDDGTPTLKPTRTVEPGSADGVPSPPAARAADDGTLSLWDAVPEDGREAPDMVRPDAGLADADTLDLFGDVSLSCRDQ